MANNADGDRRHSAGWVFSTWLWQACAWGSHVSARSIRHGPRNYLQQQNYVLKETVVSRTERPQSAWGVAGSHEVQLVPPSLEAGDRTAGFRIQIDNAVGRAMLVNPNVVQRCVLQSAKEQGLARCVVSK